MNNARSGRVRKPRRNQESAPPGLTGTSRGNGPQKEIIVNVSNRETRIALLEDGHLMEYRVEREERVVGSIFKGIVQNVLPGMDAAFVDIGLERNAFLYVADIIPDEGSDTSPASIKRSELRRRKIKDIKDIITPRWGKREAFLRIEFKQLERICRYYCKKACKSNFSKHVHTPTKSINCLILSVLNWQLTTNLAQAIPVKVRFLEKI